MLPKRAAFGLLSFSVSSALIIGCGDGEPAKSTSRLSAGGGEAPIGGASATPGGSSAEAASGGYYDAGTQTGGNSNAGTSNNGGSDAGDSSGGTSAAGTSNNGGSSEAGASNGGSSAAGTSTNGGDSSSTGGTTSTGTSSATGGSSETGGSSLGTGGSPETGGTPATGGIPGTGGTSSITPCAVTFVVPKDGQTYTETNDANGDCADGIQTDILVATSAPDGTTANLYLSSNTTTDQLVASATVAGAVAQFLNVTLQSSGQVALKVAMGSNLCAVSESIVLNCLGAPTCAITAPNLSAAHPYLNGVATPAGDRVSSLGSPYQAQFSVATDASNGQKVTVTVDGTVSVSSTVSSGVAVLNVPLIPDGTHSVQASCFERSGQAGASTPISYQVDTTGPDLTVTKVTGGSTPVTSPLADGDHFTVDDDASADTGIQLKLCATTPATDAINLPATLAYQNNFCVAVGGNSPSCEALTAADPNAGPFSGCALLTCPGSGTFDVTLTLTDTAGNPTSVTRNNLTCASSNPSVSFLSPESDTTFSNIAKRILAADNVNATLKDKDPVTGGAQFDVVACTSASTGTAQLAVGRQGDTLNNIATATVAKSSDGSAAGSACQAKDYAGYITFPDATLPESASSDTALIAATRLQVTVTDENQASGSGTSDVWVDSVDPTLTIKTPATLCGSYLTTSTATVVFSTSLASTFSGKVKHEDNSETALTLGAATSYQISTTATWTSGVNTLTASVTELSGNTGNITGCNVTYGQYQPPTVAWSTPVSTSLLTAPNNTSTGAVVDTDTGTSGWQGTLKVCTNIDTATYPTATVEFFANGTDSLGTAPVDAVSKCATLTSATVPEGDSVTLTATTSTIGVYGTGSSSITVPVDVTVPSTPTGVASSPTVLSASVKNRRQTSFSLAWTAAADGTKNAAGYEVRVAANVAITSGNFDTSATQSVAYTGTPAAAGSADGITVLDRLIETDYYFAIRAVDIVGNKSGILATGSAARAVFLTTPISPPSGVTGKRFGYMIDGSGDLNKDGYSDLVVGSVTGNEVDIYLGSSAGVSATPSVRISGLGNSFGYQAVVVGDVNGDTYSDLAISTWAIDNGKVSVFYGRANWPSTMTESDANSTVIPDLTQPGAAGFAGSRFGVSVAKLGDFNGDGVDDFAIGASAYNSSQGHVSIILGAKGLPSSIKVPQAFTTGRAIRIDGESGSTSTFGLTMAGIGSWYSQPATQVLVVGAPNYNTNRGKLYAYAATTGAPSLMNVVTGQAASDYLGTAGIRNGGDLGYFGKGAVITPRVNSTVPPGNADLYSGADAEGPFGRLIRLSTTDGSSSAASFAALTFAGGMPGSTGVVSYIGNERTDLVVTTKIASPRIYIIDGRKVAALFAANTSASVQSVADITYTLPGSWSDFGRNLVPVRDLDNDGFGDIAIGNSSSDGSVLVLR